MYETIYYNVVEYSDVLLLKKKKKRKWRLYISREHWTTCFFFCIIQDYKTTFNAVRQKNGTCDMTVFVICHLGIVYQSFLVLNCTIMHSSLWGLITVYPLTQTGSKKWKKKNKSMSEFHLVTAKLHSRYLDQTFLFFITNIASPSPKTSTTSQLRDKRVDNINTHRKRIPAGRGAKENSWFLSF